MPDLQNSTIIAINDFHNCQQVNDMGASRAEGGRDRVLSCAPKAGRTTEPRSRVSAHSGNMG